MKHSLTHAQKVAHLEEKCKDLLEEGMRLAERLGEADQAQKTLRAGMVANVNKLNSMFFLWYRYSCAISAKTKVQPLRST